MNRALVAARDIAAAVFGHDDVPFPSKRYRFHAAAAASLCRVLTGSGGKTAGNKCVKVGCEHGVRILSWLRSKGR